MPGKPVILFVGAQKGGVGKSTGAYSIASLLAGMKVKTCILDCDPQANLTRSAIEYMLRQALKDKTGKILVTDKCLQTLFSQVEEILLVAKNNRPHHKEVIKTFLDSMQHNDVKNFTVDNIKILRERLCGANEAQIETIMQNNFSPEDREKLGDVGIIKLRKTLSELFGSANILDAFDWLSETVGDRFIEQKVAGLAAGLLPVPLASNEREQAITANHLSLLLGHQSFFLKYNRLISLAIEGLAEGGTFKAFISRLRAINYLIRHLAEIQHFDVIVIDSNPAAIEINEALLMMSDYFIMPLSPEPYSDHAAISMLSILEEWKAHFDQLYHETVATDNFPLISRPPKCLGFYFQKVPLVKGRVREEIPQQIIDKVKLFYEEKLCPFLRDQQMGGQVEFSTQTHIKRFHKDVKNLQIEGGAVVAGESKQKDSLISRYKRVIWHAFEKERGNLTDNFARAIEELGQAQKKQEDFSENWVESFRERFSEMGVADRVAWIKNTKYFFDLYDFKLILDKIRETKFRSYEPEEANNQRIYVMDPFWIKNNIPIDARKIKRKENVMAWFPSQVSKNLEKVIVGWRLPPRVIIIPFVQALGCKKESELEIEDPSREALDTDREVDVGLIWRCLRIEVDAQQGKIDILYDDPFGGILDKRDRAKNTDVPVNLWNEGLRTILHHFIALQLKEFYGARRVPIEIKRVSARCKPQDQLGFMWHRNSMSGLIILSNISKYIPAEGENAVTNQQLGKISQSNLITKLLKDNGLSAEVVAEVMQRPEKEKSIYDDVGKKYDDGNARRKRYVEIISENFPFLFEDDADISWYESRIAAYAQNDQLRRGQEFCLKAIANYVKKGLNSINVYDHYPAIEELYEKVFTARLELLLDFVVILYERTYWTKLHEQKGPFAEKPTKQAIARMKSIFISSSEDVDEDDEQLVSESPGVNLQSPVRQQLPRQPLQQQSPRQGTRHSARHDHVEVDPATPESDAARAKRVIDQLDGQVNEVTGDGNCFFHAVSRTMSHRKLSRSLLNAEILRQRAVHKFQQEPSLHVGFGVGMELGTLDAYTAQMQKKGIYAVGPIIDAMALELKVRVVIFEFNNAARNAQNPTGLHIIHINDINPPPQRTIFLSRIGNNHFNAVHFPHYDVTSHKFSAKRELEKILLKFDGIESANNVLTQLHQIFNDSSIKIVVQNEGKSLYFQIELTKQQYLQLNASSNGKNLRKMIDSALNVLHQDDEDDDEDEENDLDDDADDDEDNDEGNDNDADDDEDNNEGSDNDADDDEDNDEDSDNDADGDEDNDIVIDDDEDNDADDDEDNAEDSDNDADSDDNDDNRLPVPSSANSAALNRSTTTPARDTGAPVRNVVSFSPWQVKGAKSLVNDNNNNNNNNNARSSAVKVVQGVNFASSERIGEKRRIGADNTTSNKKQQFEKLSKR